MLRASLGSHSSLSATSSTGRIPQYQSKVFYQFPFIFSSSLHFIIIYEFDLSCILCWITSPLPLLLSMSIHPQQIVTSPYVCIYIMWGYPLPTPPRGDPCLVYSHSSAFIIIWRLKKKSPKWNCEEIIQLERNLLQHTIRPPINHSLWHICFISLSRSKCGQLRSSVVYQINRLNLSKATLLFLCNK